MWTIGVIIFYPVLLDLFVGQADKIEKIVCINGQGLRFIRFCNFDKAVLDSFNREICRNLDFIGVTHKTISERKEKKGFGHSLHPGKLFEMCFDFFLRNTLESKY